MHLIAFPGARQSERENLSRVVENQTRLHNALKLLFDLLENYGPIWYTQRYHDAAKSALRPPVSHAHTLNKRNKALKKAA